MVRSLLDRELSWAQGDVLARQASGPQRDCIAQQAWQTHASPDLEAIPVGSMMQQEMRTACKMALVAARGGTVVRCRLCTQCQTSSTAAASSYAPWQELSAYLDALCRCTVALKSDETCGRTAIATFCDHRMLWNFGLTRCRTWHFKRPRVEAAMTSRRALCSARRSSARMQDASISLVRGSLRLLYAAIDGARGSLPSASTAIHIIASAAIAHKYSHDS